MSRPLLVLRPEPGASATALVARAMGRQVVVAPLFKIRPLAWTMPTRRPWALLMTSANAARFGGNALTDLMDLPVYAVGEATAAAARQVGFSRIVTGDGDATQIVARAAADGMTYLLHLAGREHRAGAHRGVTIERRILYAADPVSALPEAARAALPDVVALLHSPRAATLFARLVASRGVGPAGIRIAAISEATHAAAGTGWQADAIAAAPTDAALLAAAAPLCDQDR
jgi:uroporphyrinogen-III synthase